MAFSNEHHYILMFIISSTLVLFASALDVSNAAMEGQPSSSRGDKGFIPLAEKHVVLHNTVPNKQTLNAHCKSTEDDLGFVRIPWYGI